MASKDWPAKGAGRKADRVQPRLIADRYVERGDSGWRKPTFCPSCREHVSECSCGDPHGVQAMSEALFGN